MKRTGFTTPLYEYSYQTQGRAFVDELLEACPPRLAHFPVEALQHRPVLRARVRHVHQRSGKRITINKEPPKRW